MFTSKLRKRIFVMLEADNNHLASSIYKWLMLAFIALSLIPLAFREQTRLLNIFDKVSVTVFIIDYILRWGTADLKLSKYKRWQAFLLYPFTPLAIIDLLSIIPSFSFFNRVLKLFRLPRLLKVLRVFRFIRYSNNMRILFRVLRKERHILFMVFLIAIAYIVTTALIMYNIEESDMFDDFFDALYWATTTLTTVGYGDIYPATDWGRIISMFSAILGVAVIALPSGVITASYLDELREAKEKEMASKSEEGQS